MTTVRASFEEEDALIEDVADVLKRAYDLKLDPAAVAWKVVRKLETERRGDRLERARQRARQRAQELEAELKRDRIERVRRRSLRRMTELLQRELEEKPREPEEKP